MNFSSWANDNDYQKQTQVIMVIICKLSLIFSFTLLSACSEPPARHDQWANYLERLTAVLSQIPEEIVSVAPPPMWPSNKLESIAAAPPSISLVEFWQLKPCALHQTIALRNSNLGKFQQPSQQLLYELTVIEQTPNCIAIIEAEHSELANQLAQLRTAKINTLPSTIYQATLNGPEWSRFHSNLQPQPTNISSGLAGLRQLGGLVERWSSGDYSPSRLHLEERFGQIYHSNAASYLLQYARQELAFYLSANQILLSQLNTAPLCFQPSPTRKARRLHGLVVSYFNTNIQQPGSETLQQWRQLNDTLTRIEAPLLPYLSTQQRHYIENRHAVQDNLITAQRAHAKLISELLSQCGLAVNSA